MAHSPRSTPSGSQLPACWNQEMDRQIAWADSEGVNSIHNIIRDLKIRFTGELYEHVIAPETVQRRLDWLEYGDNDYFKEGMVAACKKAMANGHLIKPFDASTYPYLDDEQREAITSLSDTSSSRPSKDHAMKQGLRKVPNENISPFKKYQRPYEAAENLVNSTSFQSTVSSTSSKHSVRSSSLPKRHASNNTKYAAPAVSHPEKTAALGTVSPNTTASSPPPSAAQASSSGTSTTVSTPSAMNFSLPHTNSGLKKHRPTPLDLTESGAGHVRSLSNITIDKGENVEPGVQGKR